MTAPDLFDACMDGNLEDVRRALAFEPSLAQRAARGRTAFHIAAQNGHLQIARLLLASGAAVDSRNDEGATPLLDLVVHHPSAEVASLLIEAGADVNAQNLDGWTPLMAACSWDRRWNEMTRLLLDHGADPNHCSKDGWTPLVLATARCQPGGPLDLLLELEQVDVNRAGAQFGWTPLLLASGGVYCDPRMVKRLLDVGASVTARMRVRAGRPYRPKSLPASNYFAQISVTQLRNGFTPLMWAAFKGRAKVAKILCEAGAKPRSAVALAKGPQTKRLLESFLP